MSLLQDFAIPCVLMEKKRVPDGAGGYMTAWEDGESFENYQYLDTSMEARRAQQDGVKSLYSWCGGTSLWSMGTRSGTRTPA